MMWGPYSSCYGGFLGFNLIGLFVQILIIVIIISIIARIVRRHRMGGWKNWWPGQSAEEILKERYAKGEISKEEYEERLKTLREQK